MKKTRFLAYGMFSAALTFALVLAGCENGVSPVSIDGTVNSTAIAAPEVTAEAVTGGVKLTWDPIVDAQSYEVWRRDAVNTADKKLEVNGGPQLDKAANKWVYLDLAADDNLLVKDTAYTYTVVAIATSSTLNNNQGTAEGTPTTIPAKGTKLDKPTKVEFEFDEDNSKVKVTVTAPTTGIIPAGYSVKLYRANASSLIGSPGFITGTSGEIDWDAANQLEGSYTVKVVGKLSENPSAPAYYADSDIVPSAAQTFKKLFRSSDSLLTGSVKAIYNEDSTAIAGYTIPITGNFTKKDGYEYILERAPVDAAGEPGTYTPVTVSKLEGTKLDGTIEALGQTPAFSTVYDRTVPSAGDKYVYRIKASKDGVDKYFPNPIGTSVSVNPRDFIGSSKSISIGGSSATGTGADRELRYTITPSALTYKGALQEGDKLVVYWAKSDGVLDYENGIWLDTQKVEFDKTALEASTPAGKPLVVPYTSTEATANVGVYVQAFLETASGKKFLVVRNIGDTGGIYKWENESNDGIQSVMYFDYNQRCVATLVTQ
ncbi:MAG: hypothetical protein LBD08_01810 [Treponema sp.]|jgi:hypothetical protein|nr:hypothetical protein [Treponema sp.]